jgi:glycosyltransferase involved in cell wall biosynthesis
MPRLLIDGTALTRENKGVGRYTFHLCLQAVGRLSAEWEIVIAVLPQALPPFPADLRATFLTLPRSSDLLRGLYLMPRLVRQTRPDVLLRPMDGVGYDYGVPMITVCHDIPELIRRAARGHRGVWRWLVDEVKERFGVYATRMSGMVVCNTAFIRNAVIARYGIPPSQTAIGYCGVDPRFYEESRLIQQEFVRHKHGVGRYILTFATGDYREGFDLLPEIAQELKARATNTCLLVAGVEAGAPYVEELQRRFIALGLAEDQDFTFEDFLGEDRFTDLVALYTAADFYLELSRHEGFGMQLAEAMACGTTCIASMAGALREVAGGFAIEINPADAVGVADAVAAAYQRGEHRRKNAEQIEHTRRFNWDRVGELVFENVTQIEKGRR